MLFSFYKSKEIRRLSFYLTSDTLFETVSKLDIPGYYEIDRNFSKAVGMEIDYAAGNVCFQLSDSPLVPILEKCFDNKDIGNYYYWFNSYRMCDFFDLRIGCLKEDEDSIYGSYFVIDTYDNSLILAKARCRTDNLDETLYDTWITWTVEMLQIFDLFCRNNHIANYHINMGMFMIVAEKYNTWDFEGHSQTHNYSQLNEFLKSNKISYNMWSGDLIELIVKYNSTFKPNENRETTAMIAFDLMFDIIEMFKIVFRQ